VAPEHQLFEDEEQQDPAEERCKDARGRQARQRLREQPHHRDAEQRADGVAHQLGNQLRSQRIVDEKNAGGDEQTAQAAKHAQPERNPERWHVLEFYDATYPFRART
jgi:hypothetical protein